MTRMIITDSTSYLTPDIIEHYNIEVVPLNVHLPHQVFKEGQGLSNKEYYNLLRSTKLFPATSQPAAGDFIEIFSRLKPGDEALVILISSRLSGSIQSALIAREMLTTPEVNIMVIDSLSSAAGLGFQVIKACEMLEAGSTLEEIATKIKNMQQRIRFFFVVDNLEYLVRGGRLSKLSGMLGNILQFKPVLTLKNGEISLFNKVRTLHRAFGVIQDELASYQQKIERLAIVHVDAQEEALKLKKNIEEHYSLPVVFGECGPVIGTHVGPGTVGLVYY